MKNVFSPAVPHNGQFGKFNPMGGYNGGHMIPAPHPGSEYIAIPKDDFDMDYH